MAYGLWLMAYGLTQKIIQNIQNIQIIQNNQSFHHKKRSPT